MKILINYANDVFQKSQRLNSKTGKEIGGFDQVISYSPKDIDVNYYQQNKKILTQKRGNGYFLWKPYFIKKTLEMINWNDYLFYCDSGSYFINSIDPLIEISLTTKQDIIVFELPLLEKIWTKRDAFILMDCDTPKYTDTKQRLGGFSFWRKTKETMNFANEYLFYCQDERIITDLENQLGYSNYSDFQENRHDQSVLSLLSKKHDLTAYRDPSAEQFDNSPYQKLIELTRKRNMPQYTKRMFEWLQNKFSNAQN